VVTTLHEVRTAVAAEGGRMFARHPSAVEIVRYSTEPPGDPVSAAQMEHHLRECASCRTEVTLVREAESATRREPVKPFFEKVREMTTGWWPKVPALVPAMAALLVLLAFPAYRGFVDYPTLEQAYRDSQGETSRLQSEGNQLRQELEGRPAAPVAWSGAVRLLVLGPTTRAGESLPIVALAAGQPYQPVVIEHRPFESSDTNAMVEILIRRISDGANVWSVERDARTLWDSTLNSMVLLVPASVLEPGEHRLEIRRQGALRFQSGFEVKAEAPGNNLEKN
jgi:hypothetical protein